MKSFKEHILLTEKVFGQLATVYHRTDSLETIDKIKSGGFQSGGGAMYGKGIYATYLVKSQLNDTMKSTYGEYIIKAKINVNKIIFLDYKEAKKVHPKNYTLVGQLKSISSKIDITSEIQKLSTELESNPKYTSDYALRLLHDRKLARLLDGVSFTGTRDGNGIVIYNADNVTPMSYNTTFGSAKKLDNEDWIDIKTKNLISIGLHKTLSNYYTDSKDKIHITPNNTTIKDILSVAPWLEDATISDAEIGIKNGKIVWYSGTWEDGVWEGGTWKRGLWKDGYWRGGTWEGGIWKDGNWKDGTWKDGRWEGGTWYNGTWEDGTWEKGIWRDGTWEDGTWEDGTWKRGTWKDKNNLRPDMR